MAIDRRDFLFVAAGAGLMLGTQPGISSRPLANEGQPMLIIDTHQHLWDLQQFDLPWLENAPEILRQNYRPREYRQATDGINLYTVYMEVDVAPSDQNAEAEYVIGLCRDSSQPTKAAVIGGRVASPDFEKYILRHKSSGVVRGVRQVLHNPDIPAGYCLEKDFIRGVRTLGKHGMSFDLCMRPTELRDALTLTQRCTDTQFILDHCGNADPRAFSKVVDEQPWHQADAWRNDIHALSRQPNVICKISGIVARARKNWTAEDLAPIVNHCLDVFGPERVVFGGDWPVCLLGSTLRKWIEALGQIIASRPARDQQSLWSTNAIRFYRLTVS